MGSRSSGGLPYPGYQSGSNPDILWIALIDGFHTEKWLRVLVSNNLVLDRSRLRVSSYLGDRWMLAAPKGNASLVRELLFSPDFPGDVFRQHHARLVAARRLIPISGRDLVQARYFL